MLVLGRMSATFSERRAPDRNHRMTICITPTRLSLRRFLLVLAVLVPDLGHTESIPESPYLQVRTEGDTRLNLRDAPSTEGGLVLRLSSGTQLRNLGCEVAGEQLWCRVATLSDPPLEAWAAAEFLVPALVTPGAELGSAAPLSPAETACLSDVARLAKTDQVEVLALDDSRPDVLVQVGVGSALAPWNCVAHPDGTTGGIEPLQPAAEPTGTEPVSPETEAACVAAIAQAAGTAIILLVSVTPAPDGRRVQVLTGNEITPWTCLARSDGMVSDIRRDRGE